MRSWVHGCLMIPIFLMRYNRFRIARTFRRDVDEWLEEVL